MVVGYMLLKMKLLLVSIRKKCFYILGENRLEMDIKINEINDSFYVDYEIDKGGETDHIIYSINYEVI